MKLIENDALTPADVPSAHARWEDLERFALTFDGYKRLGPRLGELAAQHREANTLPATLDELRGCLFLEQRSWRHVGGRPDERAMTHLRRIVEAIRAHVSTRG